MKKGLFLFSFIIISRIVFAQNSLSDSLLKLLKNGMNDSVRVDILYQLSENAEDDRNILYYATEALKLAEKINYKKGIANASNNIGYVYDSKEDNKSAMEYYQRSLKISTEINDQKGAGISSNNIGYLFYETANYEKALEYYLNGLEMQIQTKDSAGMATTMHNISGAYRDIGKISEAISYEQKSVIIQEKIRDYNGMAGSYNAIGYLFSIQNKVDKAMEYYQKSLVLSEKTGNKKLMALAYNNIGSVTANPDKVREYYNRALKIYEEIGNRDGIASALGNIGHIYMDQENYEKALEMFTRCLKIRVETGNREGIASGYINIGDVYENEKKFEEALAFFLKGLDIKREINEKRGLAIALNRIGSLYLRMNRLKEAESYCLQSFEIAKELAFPINIQNAAYALSRIYAAQKRYKEAYDMHLFYKQMSDSVYNSEATKNLAKMTMQFDFDKKELLSEAKHNQEQAVSKKEIEKQKVVRNYTVVGFSALLSGLAAFMLLFFQRRKSLFQQTVSEVEMKALRAQMNPHFIFNSLNSISKYMHAHDTETAAEYLQKFAKVMRLILENSQHTDVLVSEDLKALELYMQLEAMRMNHKFTFEIHVDESVDAENMLIPPLILQPFVENAIWHGFTNKEGSGKIIIQLKNENNMLKCTVEDNGVGRIKSSAQQITTIEKKSLGMKITKSRIGIINKLKKSNAGIELIDLDEGMKVIVTLPLELAF